MATYDYSEGNVNARTLDAEYEGSVYLKTVRFDASVNNLVTADVARLMVIPPYHVVQEVVCNVITAEGTTNRIEVGTSADADGFIDSVNLAATGVTKNSAQAHETKIGAILATQTYLTFTVGSTENIDSAVFEITALIANMAGKSASLI